MAQGREFTVNLFKNDFEAIQNWVLEYPNKETGGELFGLWSNNDNAVAHIVLGPGKGCRHGEYSFYQDVSYLKRVGNLLTNDNMLGHIGEWHSHHQLTLDEPSEGDYVTIGRNYPKESRFGFILMIANIITEEDVKVTPYLFFKESWQSLRVLPGHIKIVERKSPFRLVSKISSQIKEGEEESKPKTQAKSSLEHFGPFLY